jgi:ABC-type branched-subunit amino acid transport system ATPase component
MDEGLIVSDIYASYGRREVLRGVSISLSSGEIVSLVGPNGAGKSTLLKVIAGALSPQSGHVILGNSDILNIPQFKRSTRGIGYLMQGGPVFSSLTVEENLSLAYTAGENGHRKTNWKEVLAYTPDLKNILGRRAGLLSTGQRQLLAIALVITGTQRKHVLLLDEPLAGLSPGPAQNIFAAIRRIRAEQGVSILLVEQNLRAAMELSDRLCVLKSGTLVAEENANDVDMRRIEEAYFG